MAGSIGDATHGVAAALGLVHALTGLRVAVLARVDLTTRSVGIVEASDASGTDIARSLAMHANALGFGHLVYRGERVCESDVKRQTGLRNIPVFAKLGVRSYIGVPVAASGGRVWGTLAAMDTQKRELSTRHLDALAMVARLVSIELDHAEKVASLNAEKQLLSQRIALAQTRDEEHLRAVRLKTVLEAAATVSHEINNPLAVLQLRLDRLAKRHRPEDSDTADDLAAMLEAASEIHQVTVRLRSVVRPVSTPYVAGKTTMLDLAASASARGPRDERTATPRRKTRKRRAARMHV